MGPFSSLPSFTIQGVTFPLARTVFVADNRLAPILCSYQPYYSGTGPNGTDPQTYAGSGNGLQAPWGNAWKFNIGSVISVFRSRLYSVKNEWDVEREARFAINGFMRDLTGRNAALSPITSTPNSVALRALGPADACIPVQSTTFVKPVVYIPPTQPVNPIVNILPVVDYKDPYIAPVPTTPTKPVAVTPPKPTPTVKVSGTTVSIPFLTSASFKPGISAAANERGKAAFITLVKKASAASKLTKEQNDQLLATVYEAIAKAMLVKKSSLTTLKAFNSFTRLPVRRVS